MAIGAFELRACLSSIENMLDRAKKLTEEYNEKVRDAKVVTDRNIDRLFLSLEHAISFPELRSLDLLCRDALERWLPDHENLVAQWHVHDYKGKENPEDIVIDLSQKRIILQHALSIVQASEEDSVREDALSIPKGYSKLTEPIHLFLSNSINGCDDYNKNVFIMTRFVRGNDTLERIDKAIRSTLIANGLKGHRADDRCYPSDRNLWDNVCTYMICCKFGIAVLENIIQDEFNPNVALEYGFMRAFGKPTLLLKEMRFKPRADILGTLWETFDILDIETSISSAIQSWIKDLNLE